MSRQMIVIAVAGLKGGVGKTTTATNLAYLLAAEQEKRVLLVDADCQGNASSVYGVYDPEGIGMAQMMSLALEETADNKDVHDFITPTSFGVDVIPANGYLMEVNGRILVDSQHDQIHILSQYLSQCREEYDFCIIDCGLQLDMTVANAILASDLVINPMRIGGFEMSAADSLASQLEDMRALKKELRMVSLITMFSSNKISREVEAWFQKQRRFDMFSTHIRSSVVVTKNSLYDGPFVCYSKNSNPAKDYRAVLDELLERLEVM